MARILIVDDERDVVTLMQFILEQEGHSVAVAGNGQEALTVLGVQPLNPAATLPDLILMDIMMPVLDGQQACLRLAGCAHAAGVPILVLTGQARESKAALGKSPNVVGFLEKPFDPKTLRAAVAKALPPNSPEVRRA